MLLHGGITPIKAFQVPLRGRARVNKNGLFVCETLEQWQSCDTSEIMVVLISIFLFFQFSSMFGETACAMALTCLQSLFFAPFIQSAKYWSNYQE